MKRALLAGLTLFGLAFALLATVAVAAQSADGTCAYTPSGSASVTLDAAQLGNARIIVGVAGQLRLPARAAVVAVATAQQESGLRNLPYGDRDSLGLFQQRPSAGWGTPEQILDPIHAATQFYNHLTAIPGWATLPLTVAAQTVQRSAYPDAYAHWEPLATAVVAWALGQPAASLNCPNGDDSGPSAGGTGGWPPETMGPDGLTPRTRTVLIAVRAAFGVTDIGGYCPGGCTTGHIPGSDHYTGHAIDIMLTPMTAANRALGDQIATWLVANHQTLAIKYVIWYDHIWQPTTGWQPYTHPGGGTSPTERHEDHVHVSVW